MAGLGGLLAVAGVLHVVAAILVLAHRERGRTIGIGLAVMGLAVGGIVFVVTLRDALMPSEGSTAPNLTGLLFPIPPLFVLLGLTLGWRRRGAG
ncbi:MAG: hypothetical protein ABIZ34_03865 [Candidatus Limnocylindrales bacterium]